MKKLLFIGLITIVFSVIWKTGFSEDNFSISGEVSFYHEAPIYISLYTYENFAEFRKKLPPEQFYRKIVPSANQIKNGKANFEFVSVPNGSYGIVAFQDLDNDGKMKWVGHDIGEPFCFYKETNFWTWHEMKFDLSENLTGVNLKLCK